MSDIKSTKVAILHDNPPLPGKKYFLASMISPESRQKHDTYGFKIHDVCETEEEGRKLSMAYQALDPDFDIFVGTVGKWSPWVFNPFEVSNVEYANSQLTGLIQSHRNKQAEMDKNWDKEFREIKEKHAKDLEYAKTQEGKAALASASENKRQHAAAVWFKIQQLEALIKKRTEELRQERDTFLSDLYTDLERDEAQKITLPLTEPIDMQYQLMSNLSE
ncbi:hypothetical protein BDK51DRAFT_42111 [Blyttiomyces helicus]|uniref:Uncharacterized protein n=2 Tax=Fungi incertae sedis TaxID=112252 RepID=A0A4P9ZSD5_9FUNG|nr:hypothetical protein BDK51DRAFT_42111 [Blyttiomyces helicus]RKP35370.1 hypothetical protein BJ085DRAFT_28180 [Dimargaris cristalligena]|eukprot:RKO94293.1 hypothetical protein BDK51DRAFT_42111 [Blyttiomyces helicus]